MDNKRNATTIRTLYSDGYSYMSLKFYNNMFSISLNKFLEKDNTGKNVYNQDSVFIALNYDQAYALYKICKDILDGKVNEVNFKIQIGNNSLVLGRANNNNQYDTILTITRDNNSTQFLFSKTTAAINNNPTTIEMGLGAFCKTIEGYLTGINSDRHLNKLTDDYLKSIGVSTNQNTSNNQNQNQGNYQNNYQNNRGNYQKRGNYNRNYNRNYNSNYNRNQGGGYNNPSYTKPAWDVPPNAEQQNLSTYQIGQ